MWEFEEVTGGGKRLQHTALGRSLSQTDHETWCRMNRNLLANDKRCTSMGCTSKLYSKEIRVRYGGMNLSGIVVRCPASFEHCLIIKIHPRGENKMYFGEVS